MEFNEAYDPIRALKSSWQLLKQAPLPLIVGGVVLVITGGGGGGGGNFGNPSGGQRGEDLDWQVVAPILIGVVGGLLAYGLIGVFLGPVVISLGYELLRAWVNNEQTGLNQTTA